MIRSFEVEDLSLFEPNEHFINFPWYARLQERYEDGVWTLLTNGRPCGFIGFQDLGDAHAQVWSVLGKNFDQWGARGLKRVVDEAVEKGFYKKLSMTVEENYQPGENLAKFLGFVRDFGPMWVRK